MKGINEIVTDEQLDAVFANADFGNVTKRKVVKYSLLKYACGFSTGHTAKSILKELNLINDKGKLLSMGKLYLWAAFEDGYNF